ncbi:MAG: ATP-dependent RNA helicase HrpA [Pseudomonadales bacterium]|nr:ATP-dependent RNA helicase HrpA [Pseudomonadales bacterium]
MSSNSVHRSKLTVASQLVFIDELRPADVPAQAQRLLEMIASALYKDRGRLSRQLEKISKLASDKHDCVDDSQRLLRALQVSLKSVAKRSAPLADMTYPPSLPIASHIDRLRATIAQHPVVIVAGETGSGKTTQLPKICLQLGRGQFGRIGHTQPRRLAARTVAARIAEEMGTNVGDLVGFQHRFSEQLDEGTRVKVMTDGVLLANLHSDRHLREYDTIIIDEAHERSLNIDFLLGMLKTILPRRPDLKLIVTSATIDVKRFADYFGEAPIIEIPGRSFPVAIEYLADNECSAVKGDDTTQIDNDKKVTTRVSQASSVQSLAENSLDDFNGHLIQTLDRIEGLSLNRDSLARDVLVFLPGEREIRDASKALRVLHDRYEVLPLYGRLSVAEQQRIFTLEVNAKRGNRKKRRVVLATNVAETSITVPGIGYVIDSGLVRMSRYSPRSKLQRLQVESISKASAQQRSGRSGRIAPGVCYRLYTEEDFNSRPDYTEPEILRTQLAAVILQMKRLGLGDIEKFPFLEAPALRQVTAGVKTLVELGAMHADGRLTVVGRQLSALPIDPRLGRMLLAGLAKHCAAEILVIVSALAVQDPRENPVQKREAARMSHERFAHSQSDFMAWLKLWDYFEAQRQTMTQSQLRKLCAKEYLSYMRMREWRDMHRQLRLAIRASATKLGASLLPAAWFSLPDDELPYEQIHRAILTGAPLQLGRLDERSKRKGAVTGKKAKKGFARYLGPRNLGFSIFPGSSQFKQAPRWVMAGEIVETSKVYARTVAAIDPAWIAAELKHLVKYEYAEPYWHRKRGQVVAKRSTLFFGLTLESSTLTAYASIDTLIARQLFIQAALVEQQLDPDHRLLAAAKFWQHNRLVLEKIRVLEARLRRRDLLVEDTVLQAFYQRVIPAHIVSRADLAKWLATASAQEQQVLLLTEQEAYACAPPVDAMEQYPGQFVVDTQAFELSYCFAPGEANDGVTARIPLSEIGTIPLASFEWLVPGMLVDKCTELIKLLPKAQRKRLVPAAQVAKALCEYIAIDDCINQSRSLFVELAAQIKIHHAVVIDPPTWRNLALDKLDPFYQLRIEVSDMQGKQICEGRDIAALQHECLRDFEQRSSDLKSHEAEENPITQWSFGDLNAVRQLAAPVSELTGFMSLGREGERLLIGRCATLKEAEAQTRSNLPHLAMYALPDKVRYLKKQIFKDTKKILPYVHLGDRQQLVGDLIRLAIVHSCFADFKQGMPHTEAEFKQSVDEGRGDLIAVANELEEVTYRILEGYHQVSALLQKKREHFPVQCVDIDAQLNELVCPGFLLQAGYVQLQHLPRYLQAIAVRLDRLGGRDVKDAQLCEKLSSLQQPLHNLLYKYPRAQLYDQQVSDFRWLLEELRVSLFAQHLKTVVPVSIQRVQKAWQMIDFNQYPLVR